MMFMNDARVSPIRSEFFNVPFGSLAGATDAASALQYARLQRGSRIFFFSNDLDEEVTILAVHPQADASVVAERQLWLTLGAERVINYNFGGGSSGDLVFPPGTQLFLYCASAPTTGSVKLQVWG